MDWFNSQCPLTQNDNIEDAAAANVTGDRKTIFSMSNWNVYTNTKAMLVNAGEPGCIYAGKYKPTTTGGMFKMIGAYVMDGLAPTP